VLMAVLIVSLSSFPEIVIASRMAPSGR